MRDVLKLLVEQTGEFIWAVQVDRLAQGARAAPAQSGTRIAIVPLQGVLAPRSISHQGRIIAPGLDSFRGQVDQAARDPSVSRIVLDVNSPGGTYAGTPEAAATVRQAARIKPVTAVVDALCASAAYFISSQASEIVATPSGELGAIGVIAVHVELSRMLEAQGIRTTIIRSRPSKADANPYEPLSEAARSALQASVKDADTEFLRAVALGRKMTLERVRSLVDRNGLGRVVSSARAVGLGLADRVATIEQVLASEPLSRAPALRRHSALSFL